jgi:hypothetical protein
LRDAHGVVVGQVVAENIRLVAVALRGPEHVRAVLRERRLVVVTGMVAHVQPAGEDVRAHAHLVGKQPDIRFRELRGESGSGKEQQGDCSYAIHACVLFFHVRRERVVRGGDLFPLGGGFVLAELELPFQLRDLNFESDDTFQHSRKILRGKLFVLRNVPRLEGTDGRFQDRFFFRIRFFPVKFTRGMHRDVVPRRHVLLLFVEGRRNVSMRTGEDHKRVGTVLQLFCVGIGEGEMTDEEKLVALFPEHERQVCYRGNGFPIGAKHGERVRFHEGKQLGGVFVPEVGRDVHYSKFRE